MLRAAVYVVVTVAILVLLSYLVNGLLGALFGVVALGYGLSWLLKSSQATRDAELPQTRRWWTPW